MKYYKLITESGETFYINNKQDISDEDVFEQAVDEGLIDAFGFDECIIEEISEDEYEENAE
jgi:hypothetical protein